MPKRGYCFKHPSNIIVAGPTGCGKTFFLHRVLQHRLFDPMPTRIVVVYAEWQDMYSEWKRWYPTTEFIHGFDASIYDKFSRAERNLLIIDDQMGKAGKSNVLMDLFTKASHHRNLTVVYLVQNIYDSGAAMRTASLNTQYFVIFKNARDRQQLVTLGRQMFPGAAQYLSKLVEKETMANPRAYVILCTRPDVADSGRVTVGVLPGERFGCYRVPGTVMPKSVYVRHLKG